MIGDAPAGEGPVLAYDVQDRRAVVHDERYGRDYFENGYWCGYNTLEGMIQREYLTRMVRSPFRAEIIHGESKLALDVGCAYGFVVALLRRLGFNAVGLDISEYALIRAALRFRSCDFVRTDASHLFPFRKRFKLVTCFEVLEHLASPKTTLRNIHDVLEDGGIFFMSTPNRISVHRIISGPDHHHLTVLTAAEWVNVLEEVGFRDIHVQCRDYVPLAWRLVGRFAWFGLPKIGITLFVAARKRMAHLQEDSQGSRASVIDPTSESGKAIEFGQLTRHVPFCCCLDD